MGKAKSVSASGSDEELRRHFDHVDRDGNGRIDEDEFVALLTAIGMQRELSVMRAAFAAIDRDANGAIDFDEFRQWWRHLEGDAT